MGIKMMQAHNLMAIMENSLLTNFNKAEIGTYREAIKTYKDRGGKLDVFIKDEAYWENGHLDTNMKSLHTNDKMKDHGEFWRVYDEVVS